MCELLGLGFKPGEQTTGLCARNRDRFMDMDRKLGSVEINISRKGLKRRKETADGDIQGDIECPIYFVAAYMEIDCLVVCVRQRALAVEEGVCCIEGGFDKCAECAEDVSAL